MATTGQVCLEAPVLFVRVWTRELFTLVPEFF